MALDSFYGGRQGASFIIVARFNTIAEMVECFSGGGSTVDKVNYGEYVIIDTLNKKDPDNGKVYRRGMNFDGPLAGAEYIGQIVGPQGESPEVKVDHFNNIQGTTIDLNVSGEDLVPGYDPNAEESYKDEIKYIYTNILDEYGNITGVKLGFQIPYVMVDFVAESEDPYELASITKDPAFIKDDGNWEHPFYQKWQIKVPKGRHGIDSTDIEIVPTKTRPEGAAIYTDEACSDPAYRIPPDGGGELVLSDYELVPNLGTSATPAGYMGQTGDVKWVKFTYTDGRTLYAKQEDCYCYIIKYKETDYANSAEGEATYISIGEKEDIKKVELSEDGYLTIYYTSSKNKETLTQQIKWIKDVNINTDVGNIEQEGQGDQKIQITYNNNSTKSVGKPLNYIIDAVISKANTSLGIPQSHLLVYYSDPEKREREGQSYPYLSPKLGTLVTGWVDLGNVQGEPGGIHSIKDVKSWDELRLGGISTNRYLKPEELDPVSDEHAGWSVTLTLDGENPQILFFNYKTEEWYSIGSLNASAIDPAHVIASSKEIPESHNPDPSDAENYPSRLNTNGFWFGQVAIKTAY